MTPEQKAKELVEKFKAIQVTVIGCSEDGGYNPCVITNKMVGKNDAKQCALICVIEQLEEHSCHTLNDERWDFWQQVQEEIIKL